MLDGMNLPNVRRALIGLAVATAACTDPAGLGDLGTDSPFGPEAPVPPGAPPGPPSADGLCALPLPPEGCPDTPTFPFFPGG